MSKSLRPLWNRIRRASRDERGSIAVEFAMIMPVLALLFGGIVEGSLLFHVWSKMEHHGRQAARAAAIGAMTKAQAEEHIRTRLQDGPKSPAVTATVSFVKGTQPVENEVVVAVSIPAAELAKIMPFGIFSMVGLATTIRMHWELG